MDYTRILPLRRKRRGPQPPPSVCLRIYSSTVVVQSFESQVNRARAQFLFNAQQLVVLGNAIRAAHRAGLDLAYARSLDYARLDQSRSRYSKDCPTKKLAKPGRYEKRGKSHLKRAKIGLAFAPIGRK